MNSRSDIEAIVGRVVDVRAAAAPLAGPLMTTQEVADLLRVSEQVLKVHRMHGVGIRYLKMGRLVRYFRRDVESYLTQRIVPLSGKDFA